MSQPVRIIFPMSEVSLKIADEMFDIIARAATSNTKKRYHIQIVLSEAFDNAYIHGDKISADACIEFEACFNKNKFSASIINEGKGIADSELKGHDINCVFAESGRGLKIIKKLSDKVEFKKINGNKFGVFIEIDLSPEKKCKMIK